MKSAVVAALVVLSVFSANSEIVKTLKNGLKDSLSCLEDKNILNCMGQRASRSLDKLLNADNIEILNGVSLEKTGNVATYRQSRALDVNKPNAIAQYLIGQADDFLQSKSIKVSLKPISKMVARSLENFNFNEYINETNLKSTITFSIAVITSIIAFLIIKAVIIAKIIGVVYLITNVAGPYLSSMFYDRSPASGASLTIVPQSLNNDYRTYDQIGHSASAASSQYYQNHPYNGYITDPAQQPAATS